MKLSGTHSQGLKSKLALLSLLPVTLFAIISLISWLGTQKVNQNLENTKSVQAQQVRLAGEVQSALNNIQRWIWIVYENDDNLLERGMTPAQVKAELARYELNKTEYLKLPLSKEEKDLFQALDSSWSNIAPIIEVVVSTYEKTEGQKPSPERQKISQRLHVAFASVLSVFEKVNTEFETISKARFEGLSAQVESTLAISHRTQIITIILSVLGSLVCLMLGTFISKRLRSTLQNVVTEIVSTSQSLQSSSLSLKGTSQVLLTDSNETVASLQTTSSAVEQISAMVQMNSENASLAASISRESQDAATQGKSIVQNMVHAVNEISTSNGQIMSQIDESNERIKGIVGLILEIRNKTKVINDIVFQTKLLSFNASVEAARAGEHGKGFAVVAEEVGNLARTSGDQAREIDLLLTRSTESVQSIVSETESKVKNMVAHGKSKVEIGRQVANDCTDILNKLAMQITSLAEKANSIAESSREQSTGVRQVSNVMGTLESNSRTNVSTSEELGVSSSEVSEQAHKLQDLVSQLNVVIHGGKSKLAVPESTSADETDAEEPRQAA